MEEAVPADRSGLRVLVAEDNAVNARLMELYLGQLGHDSTLVSNGEEAVAAVLARDYDVVLMDAQMPILGGVDATEAIRLLPVVQPRIVAVTASVLAGDRTAFLAAGADEFIAKPVRLTTLAETLAQWLPAAQAAAGPTAAGVGTSSPTGTSGVLDEETVDELRDLGEDAFAQLYRQYLASLDDTVAAVCAAAQAPLGERSEEGSVHRLAHRLKGGSSAMGALRLADICRRLEEAPTGAAADGLLADLVDLRREHALVRAAIGDLLGVGLVVAAVDRT
jgi:CheY-like chemotaxis protein/HPt (histidine-containing phosphotransfer) domain-containing protein